MPSSSSRATPPNRRRPPGTRRSVMMIGILLSVPSCCRTFAMKSLATGRRQPHPSAITMLEMGEIAKGAFFYSGRSSDRSFYICKRGRVLVSLRGGSTSENSGPDDLRRDNQQNVAMSVVLALSYLTVMGAKCALPTVLSLLLSPTIGLTFPKGAASPKSLVARQFTLATLAIAGGKILLGPLIDHFGGILSLKAALGSLAVLLFTMATTQSFPIFGLAWILVDFFFSSCWPACISAIHQCFPASDWTKEIGHLAMAARAGNSLAFALFASILHAFEARGTKQYWRPVFLVAAGAQIFPLLLLSAVTGKRGSKHTYIADEKRPSLNESLLKLREVAKTLDFWLHLVNRSALMILASFLLFVPTLMTEVFAVSATVGAQAGSLYALGCLASLSTLSKRYTSLKRGPKVFGTALFLLIGSTGSSLALLGHAASAWSLTPLVAAVLMGVWGFSFAIPFYIPASVYALRKGGEKSSATIADFFDIGGFGALAIFNGYVAGIAHSSRVAWVPTFLITTGCALTSFLSLSLAVWREES